MKWTEYLKDQLLLFACFFGMYIFAIYLFIIFHVNVLCMFLILFFSMFLFLFCVFYSFGKKKHFYDDMIQKLEALPQKYLLVELLKEPQFLEGNILYQVLKESDKDMNEHIKTYQNKLTQFKEYLELWIHEIKTPLARAFLLLHKKENEDKDELEKALLEMENDIDQVLYYTRSEVSEKDYYIHSVPLKNVVNRVIIKNQNTFIYQKIQLELKKLDYVVDTDCKWLEFIINQIIQNSFKYCNKEQAKIRIMAEKSEQKVILSIWDNGIGIKSDEISRVFEQSFTGSNGRLGKSSTGMGLFICKNLCDKLGHIITIESKENEYTKVSIVFGNHSYYDVVRKDEER